MKRLLTIVILLAAFLQGSTQNGYTDSINEYMQEYVSKHEVVAGEDKQYFRFYPADEQYRVAARFEKVNNGKLITMETSGTLKKTFRVYGIAYFSIHDTAVQLTVYQSQNLLQDKQYKDYLFLPFTDLTSGEATYGAGRYIDLKIQDVQGNSIVIDFNKTYNPYCAYVSGKYNCPVPPADNNLPVSIPAGEKTFAKEPH